MKILFKKEQLEVLSRNEPVLVTPAMLQYIAGDVIPIRRYKTARARKTQLTKLYLVKGTKIKEVLYDVKNNKIFTSITSETLNTIGGTYVHINRK